MIDNTRWDTAAVLANGVLNRAAPESKFPDNAQLERVHEDEWTTDSLRNGLASGGLIAKMYYGLWRIWKEGALFSGELMQYRKVTDEFQDKPVDFALEKAEEWARNCSG